MHNYRYNLVAARVVDDGIGLLASGSRDTVARFMHQHGVNLRVIGRVLSSGARHREPIPTLTDIARL